MNIEQSFQFVLDIDQLKAVERQTLNIDGKRRENTAEHSWSLAMAVMAFKKCAKPEVDINRCLKLALTHDLVEIHAGDTFAYDTDGLEDKKNREIEAAKKLFRYESSDDLVEFHQYWLEYEDCETPESIYVNALDRLLPIFFNTKTNGHSWQKHGVTSQMVIERNKIIQQASEELWQYTLKLVADAVEQGILAR